jgi:hypothetical protein
MIFSENRYPLFRIMLYWLRQSQATFVAFELVRATIFRGASVRDPGAFGAHLS